VNVETRFADDIAAVGQIDAVPKILELLCRTTGLGFTAVARVTEERWIACAVRDEIAFGLEPGGELDVRTTLCDEVRQGHDLVVIDNVAEDDRYCHHATPKMYGFQSYISVPIVLENGEFFGTLCGIDPKPARLNNPETINMFTLFAELVAFHLTARDRVNVSEEALLQERRQALLRDQFIAILGHDLRNPLAAVQMGAGVLARTPANASVARVARVIQSSALRMAALIENVLDFARGQLGAGLSLNREAVTEMGTMLEEIVAEHRTTSPDRTIESEYALSQPVYCDPDRVAQLLSNLLANALTHGDASGPVRVSARSSDGTFELSVSNAGKPIPPEVLSRLFDPFERGSTPTGHKGLGLGLYIAAEIARAHGGRIDVSSSPDETRFTFRMTSAA
jgi:signal transduction histidine kinase